MINRKIILSSVIAGVVSLSASHHVTAALPNFPNQGQAGAHNQNMQVVQQRPPVQLSVDIAMNVALYMSDKQNLLEFAQVSKKCNAGVERLHFNPVPVTSENYSQIHNTLETQAFYTPNDFRLPTYKEIKEARDILIFVDMFGDNFGYDDYQINRFRNIRAEEPTIVHARFEYPVSYAEAQHIVARDGQHYKTMRFKNVSMDLIDALDIPEGEKNGEYALHYRDVNGVNRFYLDTAETQEILIKKLLKDIDALKCYYFQDRDASRNIDLSRFHHVRDLSERMFTLCPNTTTVTLPKNLKEIPQSCFSGCSSLKDIKLDNISVIGDHAFFDCLELELKGDSLKRAKIIGHGAFGYLCTQGVQTPDLDLSNLTSISLFAFAGRGLQGVTLSENMYDRVPEYAFDEKVVITYVDANGQQVFQETGADIMRK